MADVKISELPDAGSLASTDYLPVDDGVATEKATLAAVVAAGGGVKRDGSSGAFTANQSMGGNKLTSVGNGTTGSQDAAPVAQVEALIAAAISTIADWKQSVRAATTAALPTNTRSGNVLTATANGALSAIDGVTLIVGDRLLVKDEATSANRGIYTVTAVGSGGAPWSLTRATDCDANAEVTTGLTVVVEEGTANGGKPFILTTVNPIVVNTTGLTFAALSSVTGDGVTIQLVAGILSVISGSIGATQLANLAVATAKLANAAVTGAKLVAGTAAGQEFIWDGSVWQLIGRKTGSALTDANATLQFTTAAQYIWPAATNTTANRTLTLGTTGLASAPNAGVGAIINIFLLRASYSNTIAVVNGGTGGGTKFTVPAGGSDPIVASFYYDENGNWELAGWEYLGTVTAA